MALPRIVPGIYRSLCDARILLIVGALFFVVVQIRLFAAQSEYADRIAMAVDGENHCTSQMRLLIDQISSQTGKNVALEEEKRQLEEINRQLASLNRELEKKLQITVTGGNLKDPVAAVVIISCSRPDYLERTVKSILKYHLPVASKFPLFISQDGTNEAVRTKALSFSQFTYMQHVDLATIRTERPGEMIAYYKIAKGALPLAIGGPTCLSLSRPLQWVLKELFDVRKYERVILLEDDMEIASDFFEYFDATASLLEKDRSIIAISSWNDNGQKQFVHDSEALYRSDFFPGLGWMLQKSLWDELAPKWPRAYWDDWLRLNETRKGRQFIRPEVCRNYNFGEHGSSLGQFFREYLEPIKLNDVQVQWQSIDLNYLSKDNYDGQFGAMVSKAVSISGVDVIKQAYNVDGDVRIEYRDQSDFENLARQFGIFQEWKDGVPRTAYKGVVTFRWQTSRRIFLVSPTSLEQLGVS